MAAAFERGALDVALNDGPEDQSTKTLQESVDTDFATFRAREQTRLARVHRLPLLRPLGRFGFPLPTSEDGLGSRSAPGITDGFNVGLGHVADGLQSERDHLTCAAVISVRRSSASYHSIIF